MTPYFLQCLACGGFFKTMDENAPMCDECFAALAAEYVEWTAEDAEFLRECGITAGVEVGR